MRSTTTKGEGLNPVDSAELGRTIEAILLVAVEPIQPQLLAELAEEPVERVEEVLSDVSRSPTSVNAGGSCWPVSPVERGCRPIPISRPTSSGSRTERCRTGSRPPHSRHWPSWPTVSLSPGVRSRPAWRQRGRREPPAGTAGLHRGRRSHGWPGPAGAVRNDTDLFLERLGLDSLEQLPAVEDFLPGPDVAGDFERDLQSALGLGVEAASDDAEANASRRSWPASGSDRGEPVKT